MKPNPDKAREICRLYHNGSTLTTIARIMGHKTNVIANYLNRYYNKIYGEEWKRKQRVYDDKEVYEKFKEIYMPKLYTRKEICEKIGCSIYELEHMFEKYKISKPRLNTYKNQKTLANVPEEVFNDVKKYAEEHNMTIRGLVMLAINEFMLREK